ncbi:MAG: toll/interleukin-1 receptor domain-containing protein [Fuerstiella sp.]
MANEEHVEIVEAGAAAIDDWRKRNPDGRFDLTVADLTVADLSGADLSRANLDGANLDGANLNSANLHGTDLGNADLRHADLRNADLGQAYLNGADLSRANLSRANLICANLSGADLSRANLNGASVGATSFGAVDVSNIIAIETVEHTGPSTIGIDTMYASNGNIPDIFLRGCGVPEEFIAYKSSFVGSAIDFYSCFISYSHEDKQFARRLHDALQGKGIRCWLDEHQLNLGDNIYKHVDRGIRVWDKVLLCCSARRNRNRSWGFKEQRVTDRTRSALTVFPVFRTTDIKRDLRAHPRNHIREPAGFPCPVFED